MEDLFLTDADMNQIFYPDQAELTQLHAEMETDLFHEVSDEKLKKAIKDAEHHTDGYYIAGTVGLVVEGLTKAQLLHLLLVVELDKNYKKILPFAKKVEILFTEDTKLGKKMGLHIYTKLALRGLIICRLAMW